MKWPKNLTPPFSRDPIYMLLEKGCQSVRSRSSGLFSFPFAEHKIHASIACERLLLINHDRDPRRFWEFNRMTPEWQIEGWGTRGRDIHLPRLALLATSWSEWRPAPQSHSSKAEEENHYILPKEAFLIFPLKWVQMWNLRIIRVTLLLTCSTK